MTAAGREQSFVQTVHEAVAAALAREGYDDDQGVVSAVATDAALKYLSDTLRFLPLRYRPQDVADVLAQQITATDAASDTISPGGARMLADFPLTSREPTSDDASGPTRRSGEERPAYRCNCGAVFPSHLARAAHGGGCPRARSCDSEASS